MTATPLRRPVPPLLVLPALAAGLGACAGSSTDPGPDPFAPEGTWAWVSSVGGIAGTTRTPASEGYGQRLELDADGTLRLFRDDELVVESTWSATSGGADAPPRIDFGSPEPFGFPFADAALADGGATLILTDPCCDGFSRTFRRAPS